VSRRRIRLAGIIAALALFTAVPAAAQAKKTISISGSTSVFPLETKLAKKFITTGAGKNAAFRILQGGSNVGVSDVSKGRVTIGASSRDPAAGDPGGLVFTKVARDAICMVTNPSNKLSNISTATIKGIFVGPTISSWSGVPGAPIGGTIDPIGRAVTSGTHDAFSKILLGGTTQGGFVAALSSNGLVQQKVKTDPQAIGYVSLPFAAGLNAVPLNGVPCTLRNAKSGAYLGVRSFYFVTQGAPIGLAKKFIKFAVSKKGQKIASKDYIPIR
jgi:phosphate transport system substrate-binding protein